MVELKNSRNTAPLIFIFNFLLLTFCFAQEGGVPGALLNYGMSPRTIALGKAFTGLADDQEAVYYNPAGLTQLLTQTVKASYLSLYGSQLGYVGYALPTRKLGSFALSAIYFTSRDIDSRDQFMGSYNSFNFTQTCFIFSYAFQPVKPVGLGTNLKLMTSKVAQYGALGIGSDIGIFLFPRGILSLGIVCQNILGPKLTHYERTDEIPVTFRGGVALKLYQERLTIVVDVVKSVLEYTSIEPHVGIEFVPVFPILTLRGGFDKNFLNIGVGIKRIEDKFTAGIDYSVELHHASSYLLEYRHKIGIFVDFGGFRTWIDATPKQFSPTPGRKDNVTWLDVHYNTKRDIKRWQLLIKNQYGEVVRTYSGWDAPPLRLTWDGLDDIGRVVTDGKYYYEIVIIDEVGETISCSDFLTSIVTLGPEGEIEFLPQDY
ncbi:MAG: PorV/PorQ family protein [candidate division WOR-3 bacterium]|nr:MAG: PorV/PorQ family protein [candidate division WOR-3 bacterium]